MQLIGLNDTVGFSRVLELEGRSSAPFAFWRAQSKCLQKYSAKTGFMTSTGFTMVELVTVITVISVIAVLVGPRFFDRESLNRDFFAAEVLSALRYAHSVAVGSGCTVQFQIDSSGYEARRDANCAVGGAKIFSGVGSAVWTPDGTVSGFANFSPPTGFSATLSDNQGFITSNQFYFDADGTARVSSGGTVLQQASVVVSTGSAAQIILIDGQTGYVR